MNYGKFHIHNHIIGINQYSGNVKLSLTVMGQSEWMLSPNSVFAISTSAIVS